MTTIHVHDPDGAARSSAKLTPLPMAALVIAASNLLYQAADLAQPHSISVHDLQSITLQFPPEPPSIPAISRWAKRFGGVLSSEPHQTERGRQIWCRTEFDYYGVAVTAFAHIPAATAAT